ncbi:unnamed protein product [Trichogramma brassicae]|uniref:rRNA adenine N(6)-methyltransferase n=1 Tax=Trichogramma brassicae TaxID=86971 RepID=A0A6H5ID16_9HYME|nr:unnamed protein product [Trichogramma brassicae]
MSALRLPPLPTVRNIIRIYRLQAVKQLSQNFLLDENITNKIVKYVGKVPNSEVLEVGAGPGAITRSILRRLPKKLVIVEKDKRFKPTLEMLQEAYKTVNGKVDIFYDDILSVDTKSLFSAENARDWEDDCPPIYIVGNLPFSISTVLIIKWLHAMSEQRGAWAHGRVKMTLTFQKEVADRLVAEVEQPHRCRLSVMAQAFTTPKLRFIIPGEAFVPKPDVDVGVVTFVPLARPRTRHEFKLFEKITRHMFSFKQKKCIKCARTLFPKVSQIPMADELLDMANVNPNVKATYLSVEDINRITTAYKSLCEKYPEIVGYNYRASRRVITKKDTKSVYIQDYDEENDFSDIEDDESDEDKQADKKEIIASQKA